MIKSMVNALLLTAAPIIGKAKIISYAALVVTVGIGAITLYLNSAKNAKRAAEIVILKSKINGYEDAIKKNNVSNELLKRLNERKADEAIAQSKVIEGLNNDKQEILDKLEAAPSGGNGFSVNDTVRMRNFFKTGNGATRD